MSVTKRVDYDYASTGAATTHDQVIATLAGDMLVVRIGILNTTVTGVVLDPSGANIALTQRINALNGAGSSPRIAVYDLDAASMPAAGSYTVRVSVGTSRACAFNAALLTGVDAATPRNTIPSNVTGTGGTQTINCTSETDALVLDVVGVSGAASSPTVTITGGQSADYNAARGTSMVTAASSKAGGAPTVTMSYSTTGQNAYILGAISYRPSSSTTKVPVLARATTQLSGGGNAG